MMPAQYSELAMAARSTGSVSPLGRWPRLLRGLGSRCRVCAAWQDRVICVRCQSAFAAVPPGWRSETGLICHAALDYQPPWSALIADFKYGGACELATPLAALLAQALQQAADADRLRWPDWVLPVPLALPRLRERGYNQSWELARRLAPPLGLQARADLVERLIDTPHQVGLDRQARGRNLKGAFAPTPAGRRLLAGASVALVDDVLTTGATAAELAAVLRQAGASEVQVWVVAHADRR